MALGATLAIALRSGPLDPDGWAIFVVLVAAAVAASTYLTVYPWRQDQRKAIDDLQALANTRHDTLEQKISTLNEGKVIQSAGEQDSLQAYTTYIRDILKTPPEERGLVLQIGETGLQGLSKCGDAEPETLQAAQTAQDEYIASGTRTHLFLAPFAFCGRSETFREDAERWIKERSLLPSPWRVFFNNRAPPFRGQTKIIGPHGVLIVEGQFQSVVHVRGAQWANSERAAWDARRRRGKGSREWKAGTKPEGGPDADDA